MTNLNLAKFHESMLMVIDSSKKELAKNIVDEIDATINKINDFIESRQGITDMYNAEYLLEVFKTVKYDPFVSNVAFKSMDDLINLFNGARTDLVCDGLINNLLLIKENKRNNIGKLSVANYCEDSGYNHYSPFGYKWVGASKVRNVEFDKMEKFDTEFDSIYIDGVFIKRDKPFSLNGNGKDLINELKKDFPDYYMIVISKVTTLK